MESVLVVGLSEWLLTERLLTLIRCRLTQLGDNALLPSNTHAPLSSESTHFTVQHDQRKRTK